MRARWAMGMMAALFLAGCASTRLSTGWVDPSFEGRVPRRVLVVASVPTQSFRRQVEEQVAQRLAERGVQAVPLSRIDRSGKSATREQVNEVVDRGNFDGLLEARYIGTTQQAYVYPGAYGAWYGGWYGAPYGYGLGYAWGPYGYYADIVSREQLETSLYDTRENNELIWTVTSGTAASAAGGTAVSPRDIARYAKIVTNRLFEDLTG